MTAKYTLYVSIGRNSKHGELSPADWTNYQTDVTNLLAESEYCSLIQFPAESEYCSLIQFPANHLTRRSSQLGIWDDGIEESATFIALFETKPGRVPYALAKLRRALRQIKTEYLQETVGFAVVDGHDNLI